MPTSTPSSPLPLVNRRPWHILAAGLFIVLVVGSIWAWRSTTKQQVVTNATEQNPVMPTDGSIRAWIVQAVTGQPLAATAVTVESDSGVKCKKEPCPSTAKTWTGQTDTKGYVIIPASIVNTVMLVTVTGYDPKDLMLGRRYPNGTREVQLQPTVTTPTNRVAQ